jgi:nucleotide-binding universal stress UspA family protein
VYEVNAMPDSSRLTHPAVILVATDLGDLDRLMPFALKQASETGARLILLHVLAAGSGLSLDAVGVPRYDPGAALEFAASALRPWCEAARQSQLACNALVREGDAARQIVSAARQFHADSILMGTRGHGGPSRPLLGSVTDQVLRSVNLPVVTVGPEADPPGVNDGREKLVLHATTLRENSRLHAEQAGRVAATQGAGLLLLHVSPPVGEMERTGLLAKFDTSASQELCMLAAETDTACALTTGVALNVEAHVVYGNPLIEILAEASERKASLIVLGAPRRSPLDELTRESAVAQVLAHARCPVLTLHDAPPQPAEPEAGQLVFHRPGML